MNLKGHLPDQEISQLSKLTMVRIFNCNNNKKCKESKYIAQIKSFIENKQ